MSVGVIGIIKSSFNLIIKNKIILLPLTVLAIVSTLFSVYNYYSAQFYLAEAVQLASSLLSVLGAIAFIIFSLFVDLWTVHLCYLTIKSIRNKGLGSSLQMTGKKFLRFVGATILCTLIVLVGLILLVIPGIYLAARLALYPYAIVVDNFRIVDSLKKSWKVTKRRWWMTFGLGFLISLMLMAVVLPIYFILFFVYGDSVFSTILINFISIVFGAWSLAAYTMFYLKFKK